MGKYNVVAVMYGSDSSEWEVACRSGEFTASNIDQTQYDVYEIFARFGKWQLVSYRRKNSMKVTFPEGKRPEIDKTDFSVMISGKKVKFEYVYIMQHGKPGENGLLQGYFEMLGIPFSSCSAFVSMMAFDKYACKSYLRGVDIVKLSPDAFVREGSDIDAFISKVSSTLQYPVFVKPTDGGSSFGISKVKAEKDLMAALELAFSESPTVLVEQGVSGREFTCAAYCGPEGIKALPVIEVVTSNEYFDYDAKYNGNSLEICPAKISDEVRDEIQKASCDIYAHFRCSGIVRMDYILAEDGLYFLEVNTIPGMTSASLVPKMVRAAGFNMTDFLTGIIENS